MALLSDHGSAVEKTQLSFNISDTDQNGVVDWSELRIMLRLAMHANNIFLTVPQLDELARHTMLVRRAKM